MDTKPIRVAVLYDHKTQLWTSVADQPGTLLCVVDEQGPMYEIPMVDAKRIRGIFQSSPIPDDGLPF
jgi:hypothetical protein